MLIQYLPWDSDFFGFRIGCYTKHTLSDADEEIFLKEFDNQRYDCVYVFADPRDETTKRVAARNQFLFVDERLIYYLPDIYLKCGVLQNDSYCLLNYSNTLAVERARHIVDEISFVSRFTHDPRLCDKAREMYTIWFDQIMNDPSGGVVVISEQQSGLPATLVGCNTRNTVGELVLVGVDSRFRGRGLGVTVVQNAIVWLYEHGAKRIRVKTQASAKGTVYLYEKTGFVLEESKAIYHVWRKFQ